MQWNTPRVMIRRFRDDDLEPFFAYRNDGAVARYQGWEFPFPREKAVDFIRAMKEVPLDQGGDWVQLAMELKSSGELIGDVAYFISQGDPRQAEIGITIISPYQGHGLAREVTQRLLDFLFTERGLHRVRATCDVDNQAAVKVLEQNGFRREAHFIENVYFRGSWASEYVYAMLEREWRELKAEV